MGGEDKGTKGQGRHPRSRRAKWAFWFVGVGSLVWLLLRSGRKPRRLAYPCQRVALANSAGFVGYLLSLLGTAHLYRRLKRRVTPAGVIVFVLALVITVSLQGSGTVPPGLVRAGPTLPAWTSPSAVSDVFGVYDVPVSRCSLGGGTLPDTPPCNDAEYALHDDGVDALVNLMESKETHFYQTALHPNGIVGADDVVVIKINNQWGGNGSGDGAGRMATNTDVLKGLIWRILQHPDGFSGEVVVAENTQPIAPGDWDDYPANAEDPDQCILDVISAFQSLGYAVSDYNWTDLNDARISGGSIADSGYPDGEYINGDTSDAYILLEDPAGDAMGELSYPKFRTAGGNYVSMRYGVWNGSNYDSERLTFINLPVLKRHGWSGATIAWKNLIGFISTDGYSGPNRYGTWDDMHNIYFWGSYGLLGREIALICSPDLHLVDAIWVAYEGNNGGDAARQDVLLASTDPFAVDWYASEHVLCPLTGRQDTSAARGGTFRNTTRSNQNAAKSVWPGGSGSYPYIDLLDAYDGSTPTDDEKKQMNVYVTSASVQTPSLTLISPDGGELWRTGDQHQIEWTSIGDVSRVSLSYSTDGFIAVDHTIVISTPNTGFYTWTTPVTPSNSTRVRVADAFNPAIFDDSDADFVLTEVIYVTYLPVILKSWP
jgi:hypothetical protein